MSNSTRITVLIIEPEKAPYPKEIGSDLSSLQEVVGGYIEIIYPFDDPSCAVVANEEGKLEHLPLNRALRNIDGLPYDVIAGNMVIVGLSEENFCSLTAEQIQKFSEKYKTPEQFISIEGKLLILPQYL